MNFQTALKNYFLFFGKNMLNDDKNYIQNYLNFVQEECMGGNIGSVSDIFEPTVLLLFLHSSVRINT